MPEVQIVPPQDTVAPPAAPLAAVGDDGWVTPPVVVRDDGVVCYRIDEWIRRFGRPGVFKTIMEDDR